jgi:predicted ABC-type ATPase
VSAIDRNQDFTFETTLGGHSIVAQLHRTAALGSKVCLWYVGLESPEMHIARVRARVARGGHDISEGKIRERYTASLTNLIGLIGVAAEIHLFDNSQEDADGLPQVKLVMRMRGTKIIEPSLVAVMSSTPDWAKPVVAAALKAKKLPAKRAARKR